MVDLRYLIRILENSWSFSLPPPSRFILNWLRHLQSILIRNYNSLGLFSVLSLSWSLIKANICILSKSLFFNVFKVDRPNLLFSSFIIKRLLVLSSYYCLIRCFRVFCSSWRLISRFLLIFTCFTMLRNLKYHWKCNKSYHNHDRNKLVRVKK